RSGSSGSCHTSSAQQQLVAPALGGVGVAVVHEHGDGAVQGVLHAVIHQGIVGGAIGGADDVQGQAVGGGHLNSLQAPGQVLGVTVVPHLLPDAGDGVEGRGLVDHGVDEVDAHPLPGLALQGLAGVGVVHRVVVELPAVDQHAL